MPLWLPLSLFCDSLTALEVDVRRTILALLWLWVSLVLAGPLHAQCPRLVWADEFDGDRLDLAKWEPMIGDGCSINLCGWGNNELQWYLAENAQVSHGTLKITAKKQQAGTRHYTSSRLRTKGKGDWTYGRFEASIKLPRGQGLWPAFWMLPTDNVFGGWPRSGEIDIMEARGSAPQVVLGTIHFGLAFPNNSHSGAEFELRGADPSGEFHLYALEWQEDEIRWYLDDFLYSSKTRRDLQGHKWPFSERFHLLLNLAVGGNFVKELDPSVLPGLLEVDYVRVYDGPMPTLKGPTWLASGAKGVVFALENATDRQAPSWTVPPDAKIVSGQGTHSITVDWGVQSGSVRVRRSSPCGKPILRLPVFVRTAE